MTLPRQKAFAGRESDRTAASRVPQNGVGKRPARLLGANNSWEREAIQQARRFSTLEAKAGFNQGENTGNPLLKPFVASGQQHRVIAREAGGGHETPDLNPQLQAEVEQATTGGEILPDSIRLTMETQFGADFSMVRIHTDSEADRLTDALGANAFTYGHHIFFNRGRFDPDTRAGRALIAHELTHVLQQTGQSPTAEGFRATRLPEGLAVQPSRGMPMDEFFQLTYGEGIERLREFHALRTPALIQSTESWWTDFWNEYYSLTSLDEMRSLLQTKAEAIHESGNRAELGLIYDCAKINQHYNLAAGILRMDPWIMTALLSPSAVLTEAVQQGFGQRWFERSIEEAYTPTRFWPEMVRSYLRQFANTPSFSSQSASRQEMPAGRGNINYEDFRQRFLRGSNRVGGSLTNSPHGLFHNEWDLWGYAAVTNMVDRLKACIDRAIQIRYVTDASQSVDSRDAASINIGIFRHLNELYAVQREANRLMGTNADSSHSPPNSSPQSAPEPIEVAGVEANWLNPLLGQTILDEINPAITRWEAVRQRSSERNTLSRNLSNSVFLENDPLRHYYRDIPSFRTIADNGAPHLLAAARAYFATESAPSPQQAERFAGLDIKAATFRDLILNDVLPVVGDALISHMSRNERPGEADPQMAESEALSIYAGILSLIASALNHSSPDEQSHHAPERRIDQWIYDRYRVAFFLGRLAASFAEPDTDSSVRDQWENLKILCAQVISSELDQGLQFAIPNDFEPDPSKDFEQLTEDYGYVTGIEPFTAGDLVLFFRTLRAESINRHLRRLIESRRASNRAGTTSTEDLFITSRAQEAMEAENIPLPTRMKSRNVLFVTRQESDRRLFRDLLTNHPVYRTLSDSEQRKTPPRIILHPHFFNTRNHIRDVYTWSIPRPDNLIEPLRSDPLLNGIVYLLHNNLLEGQQGEDQTDHDNDENNATSIHADEEFLQRARRYGNQRVELDHWTWYQTLHRLSNRESILRQSSSLHRRELYDRASSTRDELIRQARLASTLDRRLVAEDPERGVRAQLDRFTQRVGTWQYFNAAFRLIEAFGRSVAPEEDRDRQMTALALELADTLWARLRRNRVFSQNERIVRFIGHALMHKDDLASHPEGILVNRSQRSTAWIDERAEILERLRQRMLSNLRSLQRRMRITGHAGDGGSNAGTLFSGLHGAHPIRAGVPTAEQADDNSMGPFVIDGITLLIREVKKDFTFFPGIGNAPIAGTEDTDLTAYYAPPRLFMHRDVRDPENTNLQPIENPSLPVPRDDYEARHRFLSSPPPDEVLVEVEIIHATGCHHVMITAYDMENRGSGLRWLHDIVHKRAFVSSMENLREVMEMFGEGMMFVISLTPVGWAVDVAQMIALIAQLSENGEMRAELEAIISEPTAQLEQLKERLSEIVDPGSIMINLLLGGWDMSRFTPPPEDRRQQARAPRRRGPAAAVQRVRQNMRNLYTVFGRQMQRVQSRVQVPVRAAQAQLLTHPPINQVVHWAGRNWSTIQSGNYQLLLLNHPVIGPVYEAILRLQDNGSDSDGALEGIEEGVSGFAANIRDTLEEMKTFSLPEKVLPTAELAGLLIGLLMDIISRRLPGKARLAYRILVDGAAEYAGARQWILTELGKLVEDTELDPNNFWRDEIVPQFGVDLENAIRSISTQLSDFLTTAPIIGHYMEALPAVEPIELDVQGDIDENLADEDSPDADGQTGADPQPSDPCDASPFRTSAEADYSSPAPSPQSSPGRRLPPALSVWATSSFGHDFSHVRLHHDGISHGLNRTFGSSALTSGSHIFLGDSVSPEKPEGRSILAHELSHVLQKTGPRPLGRTTSTSPEWGRSRRSLRWKPHEEHSANRMAQKAMQGADGPITVEGRHGAGLSPTPLEETMPRFLQKLSSPEEAIERRTTLDRQGRSSTRPAQLERSVEQSATAIWDAIKPYLNNTTAPDFANRFHLDIIKTKIREVMAHGISRHTANRQQVPAVDNAISHLAFENRRIVTRSRTVNGRRVRETDQHLNEQAFLRGLKLYLYARTGVILKISGLRLNTPEGQAPTASITGVKVENLDLTLIEHRELGPQLQRMAVGCTWPSEFGVSRRPTDEQVRQFSTNTSSPMNRYRGAVMDLLQSRFPEGQSTTVWGRSTFGFNNTFKALVTEALTPSSLSQGDVPPWGAYMQPTKEKTAQVARELGFPNVNAEVGLHLNTHGHFKSAYNSLSGADRQSHHTTQFLLAEYFHCDKDFRPFKRGLRYPGVVFTDSSNDKVDTIGPIKVRETYGGSNRGEPMPAILLSSHGHLGSGSNLHIAPVGPNDETASQGYAIHLEYKRHIPDDLGPDATQAQVDSYTSSHPGAGNEIRSAIASTYAWMRTHMSAGLRNRMPGNEITHYRRSARGDDSDDSHLQRLLIKKGPSGTQQVSEDDLRTDVQNRARTVYEDYADPYLGDAPYRNHNNEIMEALGWHLP